MCGICDRCDRMRSCTQHQDNRQHICWYQSPRSDDPPDLPAPCRNNLSTLHINSDGIIFAGRAVVHMCLGHASLLDHSLPPTYLLPELSASKAVLIERIK
jgi:hypothetical protein